MNKKTQIIIGIGTAILAAVAVFVCFANCFKSGDGAGYPSGTCFDIMFAPHNVNRDPHSYVAPYAVPGLIAAFVLQCVAFLFAFIGAALRGKVASVVFGIVTLLLAGAGIIWLMANKLYIGVNPLTPGYEPNIVLGAGAICSVVFSFAGAALAALGAFRSFKA
ncbi:MAG: hypothetical protein MJ239_02685 [Bacilli bacterium]|nr:hypothetical protein [Bacilli bacterium]